MYEAFYGLTLKPFQISPDAEFYFDAAPHRRAMDYLLYLPLFSAFNRS